MAEVTAALVKELREKTGAGMMDCKRALGDSGGDIEAAVDWLRKKGLSAAAKKAGRVAAEGLIGVATRGAAGAVVEVNSETDFVARNKDFQSFVQALSRLALDGDGELETLKRSRFPGVGAHGRGGADPSDLDDRRKYRAAPGQAAVDRQKGPCCPTSTTRWLRGSARSECSSRWRRARPADKLAELGKQLAMHIAAANPLYLDIAFGAASGARPRARCSARAGARHRQARLGDRQDGRGAAAKVLRRIRAARTDLSSSTRKPKFRRWSSRRARMPGAPIRVASFARFALGEGIERQRTDFAAEVAAQLKS